MENDFGPLLSVLSFQKSSKMIFNLEIDFLIKFLKMNLMMESGGINGTQQRFTIPRTVVFGQVVLKYEIFNGGCNEGLGLMMKARYVQRISV